MKYVNLSEMMSNEIGTFNRAMQGYTVSDFNQMMRSINGNGKKKRLVIGHQNLRGGHMVSEGKLTQVETIITTTQPDVLGISEPELYSHMLTECTIDGYEWQCKEDSPRINVLVNSNLDYRRRKDLERKDIAAIWIEISPKNKKPVLICQMYREWRLLGGGEESGSKEENFARWKTFVEVLKLVAATKQEFHLLGDMNLNRDRWQQVALNRLDEEDDEGYESDNIQQRPHFKKEWWQTLVDHLYEEVLSEHPEIVQLINKPTWFKQTETGLKKSCLDLYFTNQPHKLSNLNLLGIAKSDHLMILSQRRSQTKIPKPTIIRKRQWSKINWGLLRTQLKMTSFEQDILDCEDLDECAERLTAHTVLRGLKIFEKMASWGTYTSI